jgi:hypothetical protein
MVGAVQLSVVVSADRLVRLGVLCRVCRQRFSPRGTPLPSTLDRVPVSPVLHVSGQINDP